MSDKPDSTHSTSKPCVCNVIKRSGLIWKATGQKAQGQAEYQCKICGATGGRSAKRRRTAEPASQLHFSQNLPRSPANFHGNGFLAWRVRKRRKLEQPRVRGGCQRDSLMGGGSAF